jgi:hypothetical protein
MCGRLAETVPLLEQALEGLPSAQMIIYQPLLLESLTDCHVHR